MNESSVLLLVLQKCVSLETQECNHIDSMI